MRFRFCWDVDCPDWLLAEMTTLSKLTSIKLRLLCTQVCKSIIGSQPLNYENIMKLTSDAKLDESATKAVVAAVRWIMENAAGSDTESHILDSELQQLGLPKEHATALTKVYSDYQEKIRSSLVDRTLKVGRGTTFSCEVKGVPQGANLFPVAQLAIHKDDKTKDICLTPDQLNALIHELTEAREMMEELK